MRRDEFLKLLGLSLIGCKEDMLLPQHGVLGVVESVSHIQQQLGIDTQIGVVLWGQSNALGSTDSVAPTTSPIDYQSPIRGVGMFINSTGNFNTLQYAINSEGNLFNSNLSMGYDLYANIGRPVYTGILARTGSPLWDDLAHSNFSPNAIGALRLIDDLNAVFLAMTTRCALYGKTPFIISVWIGSEADSQTDANAAAIRTNYEATKAYLLANGAQIDAEIVSILNTSYASSTATQIATARSRMHGYCASTATAYAMDMNQFPLRADNIHFTGAGQEQIGLVVSGIIRNDIFGKGIEVYPGSYSTEAKNALKNYRSDMPTGYKDAIADFIDGLQADGNLNNMVVCQCRAMDTQASAMIDMMGIKYAVGNGGTHDPGGGITYDGVDDYTDTGFQPDDDGGTIFTLNNAGFGVYVVDNLDTGTGYLSGAESDLGSFMYMTQTGTQLGYTMHSAPGGVYLVEDFYADASLYICRRTAASGVGCTALIKGSTVLDSDNVTSTALGIRKIYEGAKDDVGTANTFLNVKTGLWFAFDPSGFDYAAFKTRVDTLIADLAAL